MLVAIDYFIKRPEAYTLPDQSITTMADKLVDEMFSHFCVPEEL